MHALLFSSLSAWLTHKHTQTHTHAIKQSASDQSRCALPSPPPLSSSLPCSVGCKHYPSNGSLEDTKTSSYLTPDTNLKALGIKHRRTKHRGPTELSSCSTKNPFRANRHKVAVRSTHLTHVCGSRSMPSQMCLSLSVHAWAAQGKLNANCGIVSGSR